MVIYHKPVLKISTFFYHLEVGANKSQPKMKMKNEKYIEPYELFWIRTRQNIRIIAVLNFQTCFYGFQKCFVGDKWFQKILDTRFEGYFFTVLKNLIILSHDSPETLRVANFGVKSAWVFNFVYFWNSATILETYTFGWLRYLIISTSFSHDSTSFVSKNFTATL